MALWWNRSAMLQLGLRQFLDRTSLLEPKFSGLRFGFDSAELAAMEFGVETGAGRLSANLENVQADFTLLDRTVQSIFVGRARLRLGYQPGSKAGADNPSARGAMVFPLDRLTVENLDFEIATPWGLSQFIGHLDVKRTAADSLEVTFQDAKQSVVLRLGPGFRTARVSVEQAPDAKPMELNFEHLDQSDKQARLSAGAGPLIQWLSTSALVPETLREKMSASGLPRLTSGFEAMRLDLTAGTHNRFGAAQGRALLTRDGRYIASADFSMAKPGALAADAHLEMPAAEVFELLKPWLPEMTREWRVAAGKIRANINMLWESNRIGSGAAHLTAYDLALESGSMKTEGGNIEVVIADLVHRAVELSADIRILKLGEALAARDIIVKARSIGHELAVERAALSTLGGALEVLPGTVDLDQRPIPLTLRVQDVDLSQLLASFRYKELSGTGTVSGELPLRLSLDAIELQDGILTGTRPGVLRYQGPAANRESLAFKALRNLGYQRLQAKVNYRPNGDYHLGFRLEGSNPEVLSGHPLAFNLNVSGQLPELLQRGILAGNFERPILEQVKNGSARSGRPVLPPLKPPIGGHQPKPPPADRRSQ